MSRKRTSVFGYTDERSNFDIIEETRLGVKGKPEPKIHILQSGGRNSNPWNSDSVLLTPRQARRVISQIRAALESIEHGTDFRGYRETKKEKG